MGALGQRDVLHRLVALRIEEIAEHRPAGERPEGERPHELAGVLAQTDGDPGARATELAQEVHRLVGGDGPGDAEDQLPSVQHATPSGTRLLL